MEFEARLALSTKFWEALRREMKKRLEIAGIGYTALDYLAVVPHLPAENTKLEISNFTIQGGGPAATAMVTVRRLGARASYMGKVGDDDFGRRMMEELEREGVDISGVVVEKSATSQFAFIMVNPCNATRTILWTRGSVSPLEPEEINLDLVASAEGLFIDDLEPKAALHAARFARARGIKVLIDAGSLRPGVRELLPYCDYIIASERFAKDISQSDEPIEALKSMSEFGPVASGVTLGERGCIFLADGRIVESPGFSVEALDTTGAGDVFHAAFLFAALQGWDVERCCVFSNAVAALKCRSLGGRSGIPTLGETLEFICRVRPGYDFPLRFGG